MKSLYQNLVLFGLFFFAFTLSANAQTKVYANAISNSTPTYVDNASQAIDGNLATSATIRSYSGSDVLGTGSYEGFLELEFASTLPANTTSYVKIETDDNLLPYLLGGSLGRLLADIAGNVLIGNQEFTVEVKNDNTVVESGSSSTATDFISTNMRIIYDSSNNYYLMITPSSAYNRIRITNVIGTLVDVNITKTFDVYEAFYITGSDNCTIGTYTSTNSSGLTVDLINLGGSEAVNPGNAIDASGTTYSELGTGVVGVAASVSQTAYFDGPSSVSDEYQVKLSVSPALIAVDVLDRITIAAYNGNTLVQQYTLASLIDLDLLGLLNSGNSVTVEITPGVVDRISVRLATLATVAVEQDLRIYTITRSSLNLTTSGGGSYEINEPATLTANVTGCNGPYTYSWTGDATASTQSITPDTSVPGTYNYVVTVTDAYGVTQSESVEMVVEALPVAGSITNGDQDICPGNEPADLELDGYTGNVIRWEYADNDSFTGATTIASTNDVLLGSEIGAINETTYFRAVVGNHTYDNVYTDGVAVNISTTTWDGAVWSNGAPDFTTVIVFTGDYSASTDLNGCNIEVNNGAVVSIPSGYNVTINGAINVNSGSFTIQNNSNLIQLTNAVNTGDVTVVKNSSSLYRLDYTMWSSPVEGQNLYDFSPATYSNRYYIYNTTTDLYNSVDANATDFQEGVGYLIRMPNYLPDSGDTAGYNAGTTAYSYPGQFTGVPNNGDITTTVSTATNGYNAVGNPYPSPINIHDFFDGNVGTIGATSALYFWRKTNDDEASHYATITKLAYTSNGAAGGDTGSGTFVGDPSTWVINPGQGFIIQATATTLNFTNSMRRAVNNNQFFRQSQQPEAESKISRYWVNLTQNNNKVAQTVIGHTGSTTNNIDYGWDGKMLENNSDNKLYTLVNNQKLSIQAREAFSTSDSFAIGYTAHESGLYSIALEKVDGVFSTEQAIYIIDTYAATTHNLKESDYSFSSEAGTFDDRFIIAYALEALSTDTQTLHNNAVAVYQSNNAITVSSGSSNITGVTVHDTRGRLLYKTGNIYNTEVEINNLQAAQQVLLVTVNTEKGSVTKKIAY